MAYARLATCYRNLGELTLASQNIRKAYELRRHTSEWEEFYIESHYEQDAVGDMEKTRHVYELWAQSYPRDWARATASVSVYLILGQYEQALAESRQALHLHPNGDIYLDNLVAYIFLNRLDDARSTAEEALANNFDSPGLRSGLYLLDFLQSDKVGMAQQVAWAAKKPGAEGAVFLALEADTAGFSGKLAQARDLSHRAVVAARRGEQNEVAADYEADAALREALFGNTAEAREQAAAALSVSKGTHVQFVATLALALSGDAVEAQALSEDLGRRFPEHTIVQFNYLPTIRAQLALSRNDSSSVIEVLQAARPYELSCWGHLYPVYLRGESYLAAHRGEEAAAEFQEVLDHRGIVLNAPIGVLAHLQLGRAYAMAGDKPNAKSDLSGLP